MENIFDNEAVAVKQLLKDKHTLLEGYVTEQLFYQQFLLNRVIPFSSGWWMTGYKNIRLFFIVKEQLTEFEQELIKRIPMPHQCWQVYLMGEEFIFICEKEVLTQEQFTKRFRLGIIRKPMVAEGYTRNTTRQQNAISF